MAGGRGEVGRARLLTQIEAWRERQGLIHSHPSCLVRLRERLAGPDPWAILDFLEEPMAA